MKATTYNTRYMLSLHVAPQYANRTKALVRAYAMQCPAMWAQLKSYDHVYGIDVMTFQVKMRSHTAVSMFDILTALAKLREVSQCNTSDMKLTLIP